MSIEEKIIEFLSNKFSDVPVYAEIPNNPPTEFITIEKTGSSMSNYIEESYIAIQSWSSSMLNAIQLNSKIKNVMLNELVEDNDIASCKLNTDYNFTDTTTKHYRYQATFDIKHYLE